MLLFSEAVRIVKEKLIELSSDEFPLELILEDTIEDDFGWVFFYNSKEYLDTGNILFMLAGNAPIIVDKFDGSVHETGTAEPIEVYIEQYKRQRLS